MLFAAVSSPPLTSAVSTPPDEGDWVPLPEMSCQGMVTGVEEPLTGIFVVRFTGRKSTDCKVDRNSSAGELVVGALESGASLVAELGATVLTETTFVSISFSDELGLSVCVASVEADDELADSDRELG